MENTPNVSSEDELLELRNEGKISEAEYQQLLAAMRKPLPDDSKGPVLGRDLKIVAYIHLCLGIYCIIRFLVLLAHNHLSIEFGILGIPIFWGLLVISRILCTPSFFSIAAASSYCRSSGRNPRYTLAELDFLIFV